MVVPEFQGFAFTVAWLGDAAFRSHLDCICWQLWPWTSSWPYSDFLPEPLGTYPRRALYRGGPAPEASLSSRTAWLRSRETSRSGTGAGAALAYLDPPSLRTAFPFSPLLLPLALVWEGASFSGSSRPFCPLCSWSACTFSTRLYPRWL